ncbi:arsenate reductase ArsC [Microbulbifer sp. A4B17]|uniref:arsenate reductase/protein-tyrosine-phosphatase family protein n=1 Tax=Microbulbifer sp. A4B17 TaxID=359370 RepID=UPI000D52D23B|nr:arsenate reductase ArsC [Microbulbifer sp. A4B17]AWF81473.1 arsenate reductase ArsC [Microbulbifer sp. A4B17]
MKRRVLFVCAGDSARSLMAEALLRHYGGSSYEACGAGTNAQAPDPRALQALEHLGISTEGLTPKVIEDMADQSFDLVITLCDKSRHEYVPSPKVDKVIAWNFKEPTKRHCFCPFYTTARELSTRIKLLVLAQAEADLRKRAA